MNRYPKEIPVRNLLTMSLSRLVSPSRLALLTAIVLLAPCVANATPYVVKLTQQGNNVVATGSGTIDLTGLTYSGVTFVNFAALYPSRGEVFTGVPTSSGVDVYSGFAGPTNFGNAIYTPASAAGGDAVVMDGDLLVPRGFDSQPTFTSSATWNNASFASLGVTPGTYTWTWGTGADQSFTLMAGVTAVPEPTALGMFGLGLLLVGGFVTLRRRGQRLTF